MRSDSSWSRRATAASVPGDACEMRLSSTGLKSSESIETSWARRARRRWSMQAFFAIS